MPMNGQFTRYRETPMKEKPSAEPESVDENRRDFLRNSVYAAYATPLITALLVESASAAQSCTAEFCAKLPPEAKPPCCD